MSLGVAISESPLEMTAEDLETMLQDLVAVYGQAKFQNELAELYEACSKQGVSLIQVMGPVVLRWQRPILEKYGQPPDEQGVMLMKHSVERRVAEGCKGIELLANEARRLLRLAPLPDRTASAEYVMAAKVDETDAKLRIGGPQLLVQHCLSRITADIASGALPAASAAFLQESLNQGVDVASVLSMLKMAKLGITAEALRGESRPHEVPTMECPGAEVFFRDHVMMNCPVVIKGALDEINFPPLRDFPDATFLRNHCGTRRVLVKSLAHTDLDGRPVFVSDPELKLPLAAFLDAVDAHEAVGAPQPFYLGKVPLSKELPELAEIIEKAPTCPRRIFGKCFGDLVTQGVFTYFGCGRNTTAVHFDAHENLLLCLCGTKRLWLYPPSDAQYLYPCNDFSRSAVLPFARFQDLSPELQQKFSRIKDANPLEICLRAGDLLYLPSSWWHCVEGSGSRNMILNWWFAFHHDKKAKAFTKKCASS